VPSKYTSRLERFGAALWVRRVAVLVLGGILAGNIAVITFAWSQHPAVGGGGILAAIWVLSLGALFILFRLWKAPSAGSAPGGPQSNGSATRSDHRMERP